MQQINEIISCTNTCLASSSIVPAYPTSILVGSLALSLISFMVAFYFRNDLKKFIGLRLTSLAFLSTAVFTVGLIFNGHFILKNLPILIPAVGIGSYLISYFFSFYLIKFSYKPIFFQSKKLQNHLSKFSKKLKVKVPSMYVFFSKDPKAFVVDGSKQAIFLSDSLVEKLDDKSLKAVLLHELYHLKRHTGMIKNFINSVSTLNLRIMPVPINELDMYEDEEIDKILMRKYKINMEKIKMRLWD